MEPHEEPDKTLRELANDLDWEGVIEPQDLEAYLNCCLDALVVHLDRERVRHGLWKQYPTMDQVRQIKLKAERVMLSLERRANGIILSAEEEHLMLEEFPDLINYAIFSWRIETGRL